MMKILLLLVGLSSVWGNAFRHHGALRLQKFNVTDQNGKPNLLAFMRASFPEKLLKSAEGPMKLLKGKEFGQRSSLRDAYSTRHHDSPHHVSLQYYDLDYGWRHFCSASIIDSCNILTTVTCLVIWSLLSTYEIMNIVAGAFNLGKDEETQQKSYMDDLRIHPSFNWETWDYDFAILRVYNCFKFNDHVKKVGLSSPGNVPSTGEISISGWNVLNGNEADFTKTQGELKNVSAGIISHKECQKYFEKFPIPATAFCAISHNPNNEVVDFGATVLGKDELTGIATFPELTMSYDGNVLSPWLISAVSAARPWIDKVRGSTKEKGSLEENLDFGASIK
jgi:hypothetical protein